MTKRKDPKDHLRSGAPTLYRPEYNEQARKMCLLGYKDAELATFFEVDVSTIHNWKKMYPKFFDSIKEGREIADARVSSRLYDRAMGRVKTKEIKIDANGNKTIIEKEIAPDPTSMIFWLKNRQRKKWTDEKKVEIDVKNKLEDLIELEDYIDMEEVEPKKLEE